MKPSQTHSPADAAFERFHALLVAGQLFKREDALLSEADTRAKLIDPLFKDVLGWYEAEIRREKPVTTGYVDYILGSNYNHLLIEAKRSKPRFNLSAPSNPRRLKLAGPHLLENRKIKPAVEQAQSYASDLGVQFCLLTNGSQIVVFRPFLPGRSWKQGTAIVFHDHRDVERHFAEFFSLLARDRVIEGSLVEAFEHLEHTTTQLYTTINFVQDPDRELVRNRVWQKIARIMGPLLTDQPEDQATQIEVIQNCYVNTPLADQTDASLDALLKDAPTTHLRDARVVDLKPGPQGKTAFSHNLRTDIHAAKRGALFSQEALGAGRRPFSDALRISWIPTL